MDVHQKRLYLKGFGYTKNNYPRLLSFCAYQIKEHQNNNTNCKWNGLVQRAQMRLPKYYFYNSAKILPEWPKLEHRNDESAEKK